VGSVRSRARHRRPRAARLDSNSFPSMRARARVTRFRTFDIAVHVGNGRDTGLRLSRLRVRFGRSGMDEHHRGCPFATSITAMRSVPPHLRRATRCPSRDTSFRTCPSRAAAAISSGGSFSGLSFSAPLLAREAVAEPPDSKFSAPHPRVVWCEASTVPMNLRECVRASKMSRDSPDIDRDSYRPSGWCRRPCSSR